MKFFKKLDQILCLINNSFMSLIKEFIEFLKENKKMWMLPLILLLLLFSLILGFGSSSVVAPFIYTLY